MPMRLSVADFGWGPHAIELAASAERLGYRRYWIGEHHTPAQTGNPILLTALVAAATRTIRVGPAGVCLPFHPPLFVVEEATMLELVFEDRIDLGVCGGDAGLFQMAVSFRVSSGLSFAAAATEVKQLLDGTLPVDHPAWQHQPGLAFEQAPRPQFWVLGMSEATAALAGRLGASFCFSEHHNVGGKIDGPTLIERYRSNFVRPPHPCDPCAAVLVSGFCADTELEATRLQQSVGEVPGFVRGERMVGNPEQCAEYLRRTERRYGAETEIVILDTFFAVKELFQAIDQRARMYELLAGIAALEPTGD